MTAVTMGQDVVDINATGDAEGGWGRKAKGPLRPTAVVDGVCCKVEPDGMEVHVVGAAVGQMDGGVTHKHDAAEEVQGYVGSRYPYRLRPVEVTRLFWGSGFGNREGL